MVKNYIGFVVLFIFILSLRLLIPLYHLNKPEIKEIAFYKGRPIFTGYDSYYFLRKAKEMREGNFSKHDLFRYPPEGIYEDKVPLLSLMVGKISKLLKIDLEKFSYNIPPVLSCLVFLVIVLWNRFFKNKLISIAGAIFAVFSPLYVVRTNVGRFDTDALNLFFPFSIAYFLNLSLLRPNPLFPAIAGIFFYLFRLWWTAEVFLLPIATIYFLLMAISFKDLTKATLGAALFLLFSDPIVHHFLIATILLLIYYIKRFDTKLKKIVLFVGLFASFLNISVLNSALRLLHKLNTYTLRTSYNIGQLSFPPFIISIEEAQKPTLLGFLKLVSGSEIITLIGLIGFVFVLIFYFRYFLVLIPFLFLGLATITSGIRFTFFLSPFVGFGFGFFLYQLIQATKKINKNVGKVVAFTLYLLIIAYPFFTRPFVIMKPKPILLPEEVRGLEALKKLSNERKCVWTWWDKGTAIQYISESPTAIDGATMSKVIRLYTIANSLISTESDYLFKVPKFVCQRGDLKIEALLKRYNKIIVNKVPEIECSGIYILFTYDMLLKYNWIYYFGSWDFVNKKSSFSPPMMIRKCKYVEANNTVICENFLIDLEKNFVFDLRSKKPISVKKLIVLKLKDFETIEINFENAKTNVVLEVIFKEDGRVYVVTLTEKELYTNFAKMFLLFKYDSNKFKLFYNDFPFIVIYKIAKNLNNKRSLNYNNNPNKEVKP